MKPQTFRASPVMGMSFVIGFVGLTALFWWLMKVGEIGPWSGWVVVTFSAFLAVASFPSVLPGGHSLKLYDEGFTLRFPFEQHRYKWESVRSIRTRELPRGRKMVSVEVDKEVLTSGEPRSTFELQIMTSPLLVRPNDLANMMNAWRDAALGLNERNGHSAVVRQNHTV